MNLFNTTSQQPTCKCFHAALGLAFTIVFQPIVDISTNKPFGYEALLRGPNGAAAATVLAQLNESTLCDFVQAFRLHAIKLADALALEGVLNFSLIPNAACLNMSSITQLVDAAINANISANKIMFHIGNDENMQALARHKNTFSTLKNHYFMTGIDGFGAGNASLKVLETLKPNIVKLDPSLVRNIDADPNKQAVVLSILNLCDQLKNTLIARGVETEEELKALKMLGVSFFQRLFLDEMHLA